VAKHGTARDDRRPSVSGDLRTVRGKSDAGASSVRADALVSALAVNDSLSFSDLKKLMKTTDGNLSVHARKLEEADYITCTKSFEGRMPKTEYKLTAAGRRALERYLDHMEALIRATRER